jgi:ferredoxin/flavodoxin---NADP+ reductase
VPGRGVTSPASCDAYDIDLLIVGAGPVGLYGAYYAGVRGLTVAVIDALDQLGGQVIALYPEKLIYDVAALPSVTGRELIASLASQAQRHQPTYLLGEQAQNLVAAEAPSGSRRLQVRTSAGREVRCGAIVVTGGIGSFKPRPLTAGEKYLGRGLDYYVVNSESHQGKNVVVVGGGDSALDWCLMLEPIAASVTLVHRRRDFRAHPATVRQVLSSSAVVLTDAEVTGAAGEDWLESVSVTLKGEHQPRMLACQSLVAALGFTANIGPLRSWGLQLRDNRHLTVDSAMATSVPGVYAAGDIADYPGKVRLISVGFGEVATAVNNAAVYLNPELDLFPGHSSDLPGDINIPA